MGEKPRVGPSFSVIGRREDHHEGKAAPRLQKKKERTRGRYPDAYRLSSSIIEDRNDEQLTKKREGLARIYFRRLKELKKDVVVRHRSA